MKKLLFFALILILSVSVLQGYAESQEHETKELRQQLQQVLQNQEQIIQTLNDMKEEMRILKIRVSRK